MKVRLIEPDAPTMHMWSSSYFMRLGLPIIGATLKANGHDVVIYHPHFAPIDWGDVYAADLVGISSTTSTTPAAYEIADDLRWRGIPVVIGGAHVTFLADEGLEHCDYVARGEGGEQLMLELIEALEGKRELDSIAGLSYLRDGVAVHNPLREPCPDLDLLPLPDFTLVKGHEKLSAVPMMTSWGCPFACNFCSVTAMFGRKYRFRSAESVVAEIKERRPKSLVFYDDNFAADKKRLKRLLQMMIDENVVVPWDSQMRIDVVRDPELLDLMRRSGCVYVSLGLESINQETLDHFEKSQTVDDIKNAIAVLHEYGINSHGMFVLGADPDTGKAVRDTVAFAIANRIDTVMLNILTPAPGTQQFTDLEAQQRIVTGDWRFYDAQHVVFRPRQISPVRLQRETSRGYRRFYSTARTARFVHKFLSARDRRSYESMIEATWLWWFARMQGRGPANRDYRRMLAKLR